MLHLFCMIQNKNAEIENKSERKIPLVTYSPSNGPLGAIEKENIQLVADALLDEF